MNRNKNKQNDEDLNEPLGTYDVDFMFLEGNVKSRKGDDVEETHYEDVFAELDDEIDDDDVVIF